VGVGGAKEKRLQELPHYTARASPRGGRVALVCPSGACGALGKAAHKGRSLFWWGSQLLCPSKGKVAA